MNKKIVGFIICILFIGTYFNIVPIFTNAVKADPNSNLIAYWSFNEGSGTIVHDSSGNGYDGWNVGGSWVTGKFGNGLEITGTDRVQSIPYTYDDYITNAFTIAAWVKWYGSGGYDRCQIFDGRYSPGNGIMFSIYPTGKLGFSIHSTSTIKSVSSVPSNFVWTHVAAVFDDASDLLKVFINGKLDGILATTDAYTNSGFQPFIGNNHWATGDGDWVPLNGVIDDLCIYNRALSDSEIQNFYYPGDTLYVGGRGPSNYTKIQNAINASYEGHTVFVYDDFSPYFEHLTIVKPIMLIGENKNSTKIYGNGENKDILFIKSDGTTIINFTIQYGSDGNSGIFIKDSSYIKILDCRFLDIPSMDAITISNSDNCLISKCIMSGSSENLNSVNNDRYISGITLESGCYNTTISGNFISNASYAGVIILEGCHYTKIINNYIFSNDLYGIRAQYCNNTFIEENIIFKNNIIGTAVITCYNVVIGKNLFIDNNNSGVGISDSVNVIVWKNNFYDNGQFGYFTYNFGKDHLNIFPDILWEGNYWDKPRFFPKPIFGGIIYQKNSQSIPLIVPWINFDWHPSRIPIRLLS